MYTARCGLSPNEVVRYKTGCDFEEKGENELLHTDLLGHCNWLSSFVIQSG